MWSLNFLTAQCIRNLFEYTFDIMVSQEQEIEPEIIF